MTDLFIIAIASTCLGVSCFLFGVWTGRGPDKRTDERGDRGGS